MVVCFPQKFNLKFSGAVMGRTSVAITVRLRTRGGLTRNEVGLQSEPSAN